MNKVLIGGGVGVVALLLICGGLLFVPEVFYDTQTIEVYDCDTGEVTHTESVLVSDTPLKQQIGLSIFLQEQSMLFKYPEVSERTIGMRGMSYDLTIVFITESGTVQSVHSGSSNTPFIRWVQYETVSDSAQYILEMPATISVSNDECIRVK